jgi:hypothetical protein
MSGLVGITIKFRFSKRATHADELATIRDS